MFKEESVKRRIEKKIKRLDKKDAAEFRKLHAEEDLQDEKMFWDMISYTWESKIPEEIRKAIKKRLSKLKGDNLSLGCGCCPYVKDSVLVDFSEQMLKFAEGKEKHIVDLNKAKLPFSDNSFDSVTMVFVVDYLNNLDKLLKEVKRVLKKDGKLIVVNSKKPIDKFYRRHEKKHYSSDELTGLLKDFDVNVEEKKIGNRVLVFIEGKK
jgi:SAM-dependent methyltransferase